MLITRTDLLAVLRDNLAKAEKHDAANLAKHEKDKKVALALFRQRLKEAAKWDYDTIKANGFKTGLSEAGRYVQNPIGGTGRTVYHERPTCPPQMAPVFARMITEVERGSQARFTLNDTGSTARLYYLATWDPDAKVERPC